MVVSNPTASPQRAHFQAAKEKAQRQREDTKGPDGKYPRRDHRQHRGGSRACVEKREYAIINRDGRNLTDRRCRGFRQRRGAVSPRRGYDRQRNHRDHYGAAEYVASLRRGSSHCEQPNGGGEADRSSLPHEVNQSGDERRRHVAHTSPFSNRSSSASSSSRSFADGLFVESACMTSERTDPP